jgi:phosphomannomutase
LPPAAKTLFEKRVLDSQKLFIMAIKLSISGIRGKYHELTPNHAVKFAQAFATYIGGGDVIIGADGRPSGKFLTQAIIAGLTSCGANVYDYGIIPTPILHWIIRHSNVKGGASITAGHNSFDWNSLIFLDSEGAYLNHLQGEEFFNLYHSGKFENMRFNRLGVHTQTRQHVKDYFKALKIKKHSSKQWKFIIDCSNGFDADIIQQLSKALDIQGVPIFCRQDGFTQKDPEPTINNARFLGTIVRETRSDGGFFLNSDASRILVVDERGEPLSEELTLPIFAMIVLEEEPTDIVTNYSTSKIIDQVAKKFGMRVFRTDVGQPYVVQMARDLKARIGGEGSGSIVYTPFSFGFDAFVFIKKMVEYLRKHHRTVSSIAREFTSPDIYKETIFLPPNKIYTFLERIGDYYSEKMSLKDGYYVERGEDWLCIRASSTVSMIRIVGEGKSIARDIAAVKELVG